MLKKIVITFVMLGLASCSTEQTTGAQMSQSTGKVKEVVYWVGGKKVPCEGVGPMSCMLVHRGELSGTPNWELFYSHIEGFQFEDGMMQKILVKEEQLDPAMVPADASSIKYTLVKLLEKKKK